MSLMIEAPSVPLRTNAHGVMRVGKTRVRLDTVITCGKQGYSPEQIVDIFDTLDLADLYAVISYYLNHRTEVEDYLEQDRLDAEHICVENERRFPSAGIRGRLLARRATQSSTPEA